MAARVMGAYTTEEGMALALLTGQKGGKVLQVSWFPAFRQPDRSPLYPAEEIHRRVQTLVPDVTCLFDDAFPVVPFPVSLPKMKMPQIYQALQLELDSRSVSDVMTPVVGFCPGRAEEKGGKRLGWEGFGLAMEEADLAELRRKYRPLGIAPDLVTLPIIPLALTFIREVADPNALIFLLHGALAMTARVRERTVRSLEVFFGGEAALTERIGAVIGSDPDAKIYGFEVEGKPTESVPSPPRFVEARTSGSSPSAADSRVRDRQRISPVTLAMLLASLPFLTGSFETGGIRVAETVAADAKRSRKMVGLILGLVALILLGVGAVLGVRADLDYRIYETQKATIRRVLKSVLRKVPPLAGTAVIESKILEYQRLRARLAPMLTPSALKLPAKVLPVLDRIGGITVDSLSSSPDRLKVTFRAAHSIDVGKLKARLEKAGIGRVEIALLPPGPSTREPGKGYTLTLSGQALGEGTERAE